MPIDPRPPSTSYLVPIRQLSLNDLFKEIYGPMITDMYKDMALFGSSHVLIKPTYRLDYEDVPESGLP